MKFRDITNEQEAVYSLKKDEEVIFFLFNRSGEITFDLSEPGAEAHIFSFFFLQSPEPQVLKLTQKHRAQKTTSRASVKAVLAGEASLTYEGLIQIEKKGNLSEAFQESRSLLLSRDAHVFTKPALEILAPDVRCQHAATASPINPQSLFFAQTRGLSQADATKLLVQGFFHEAVERMEKLGVNRKEIESKFSVYNDQFTINTQ